jgi:hypothetical protein
VTQKSKEAMESYDLMDYDAAKKSLTAAIAAAKKGKLDKDPVTAKAYIYLGLASFASGDTDGAKAAFGAAVLIDPKIQIEAAYKSPELVKLLDTVRSGGGGGANPTNSGTGPADPAVADDVDCKTVKGLQHTIIDTGKGGVALPIDLHLGAEVKPTKVVIHYRAKESPDFTEVAMTKQGNCKYVGQIPGKAMRGTLLFYYVAAYNDMNKVIVSKGTSGAPNTMDITGGENIKPGSDDEDPINKKPGGNKTVATAPTSSSSSSASSGGSVTTPGVVGPKKPAKVYLAIVGGTGFGYVTGTTESGNMVETCCVGNSFVVITPELGFNVNQQLSIGVAARFGLPIGANVDPPNASHSTLAPGGLVRVRYGLSPDGEGVRVMGQIGGGVMRNTIKLSKEAAPGMDTDIVAQGPLLLGAGIGYTKKLAGNIAFMADLSALAGIAVTDHIGSARLNTGVGGDVSMGLAVGF